MDDMAIMHLSYGLELSRAIEVKQVAQQEAERSKFMVAKTEQERPTAIIQAQGESEVAKLISDAIAWVGIGLIELRMIEASREVVNTLARKQTLVFQLKPKVIQRSALLATSTARKVNYDNRSLIIYGQQKLLISAAIHYPRSAPTSLSRS
ncbi:hypothetical protein EV2_010392 [Malus domestica]